MNEDDEQKCLACGRWRKVDSDRVCTRCREVSGKRRPLEMEEVAALRVLVHQESWVWVGFCLFWGFALGGAVASFIAWMVGAMAFGWAIR